MQSISVPGTREKAMLYALMIPEEPICKEIDTIARLLLCEGPAKFSRTREEGIEKDMLVEDLLLKWIPHYGVGCVAHSAVEISVRH
jgi:hypothetical protein